MTKDTDDESPSIDTTSDSSSILSFYESFEPNLDLLIYSTAELELNDLEVYKYDSFEDKVISSELIAPIDTRDRIEKEILYFVEYFFSVYNLAVDKYLRGLIESSDDGFVHIETIYFFDKIQRFKPWKYDIVNVLRTSNLLEISKDGLKLRRKIPIQNIYDYLPHTYIRRSLFFSGFDADQDLEALRFDFIQMLLEFADEEMQIDVIGETGDYILGRLIPHLHQKEGLNEFKGSIQVVFLTHEIALEFFEFLKDGCYFNGKHLSVQNNIENYMSYKELVRISGYRKNVHKSSLAQFFKELSPGILKIEFSSALQGPNPFAIVRLKSETTEFINKVNTTIFDVKKYPPKINSDFKTNHDISFSLLNPPLLILDAGQVTESEFPGVKAFLLEIASRTQRKREIVDNDIWDTTNIDFIDLTV